MRLIARDVARSVVCVSVCVEHTRLNRPVAAWRSGGVVRLDQRG